MRKKESTPWTISRAEYAIGEGQSTTLENHLGLLMYSTFLRSVAYCYIVLPHLCVPQISSGQPGSILEVL